MRSHCTVPQEFFRVEAEKTRYNLGVAYLKLGQKELAMDQYWELRKRDDELARQLIHRILPGYSEGDDLTNPVIRRQK